MIPESIAHCPWRRAMTQIDRTGETCCTCRGLVHFDLSGAMLIGSTVFQFKRLSQVEFRAGG